MKRFTDAVCGALLQENWYAALALALALPDICSSLETPDKAERRKVGRRYARWFKTWLEPMHTMCTGADMRPHVFLNGNDCYALRCSLLHQGTDDIMDQQARDVLERFQFIAPVRGVVYHRNQIGNHLQLQVDIFCREIVNAVHSWEAAKAGNATIAKEKQGLLVIEGA